MTGPTTPDPRLPVWLVGQYSGSRRECPEGSEAGIVRRASNVRFWGQSGHGNSSYLCPLIANSGHWWLFRNDHKVAKRHTDVSIHPELRGKRLAADRMRTFAYLCIAPLPPWPISFWWPGLAPWVWCIFLRMFGGIIASMNLCCWASSCTKAMMWASSCPEK